MVAILVAAAAAEAGMLVASHRVEVVAIAEVVVAGMAGIKSISQRKAVSRFEFEPNVQTDNDS